MVHRHKGLLRRKGQRLAGHKPHHQPADQAGPGGGGNRVHIVKAEARLAQGGGDERIQMINMGASGDLRHHAAIGRVLVELGQHKVRADGARPARHARHNSGGGLVAAGFKAQNRYFVARLVGHLAVCAIHRVTSAGACVTGPARKPRIKHIER